MRVLLTGLTSFVGFHLAAGFKAAGHEVTGTLSRPGVPDGIRGERVRCLTEAGVARAVLNLADPAAISRLADAFQPDLWIQHAGHTADYASSDYDLAAGHALNVAPLKAIYAAMSKSGGGVLITGTVSEYADSDLAHREEERCFPSTPYGLSKLTETLYAQQLSLSTGVATRVARLFLPFGLLDAPQKLLPAALQALHQGREVDLSPCLQRRDFIAVGDVVDLYLALAADFPRTRFDIFNACSGEAPRLKDVVLSFAENLGADPALCRFGARPMRPGEPAVVAGSNDKARVLLGWSPRPWDQSVKCYCREFVEATSHVSGRPTA